MGTVSVKLQNDLQALLDLVPTVHSTDCMPTSLRVALKLSVHPTTKFYMYIKCLPYYKNSQTNVLSIVSTYFMLDNVLGVGTKAVKEVPAVEELTLERRRPRTKQKARQVLGSPGSGEEGMSQGHRWRRIRRALLQTHECGLGREEAATHVQNSGRSSSKQGRLGGRGRPGLLTTGACPSSRP